MATDFKDYTIKTLNHSMTRIAKENPEYKKIVAQQITIAAAAIIRTKENKLCYSLSFDLRYYKTVAKDLKMMLKGEYEFIVSTKKDTLFQDLMAKDVTNCHFTLVKEMFVGMNKYAEVLFGSAPQDFPVPPKKDIYNIVAALPGSRLQ